MGLACSPFQEVNLNHANMSIRLINTTLESQTSLFLVYFLEACSGCVQMIFGKSKDDAEFKARLLQELKMNMEIQLLNSRVKVSEILALFSFKTAR